MQIIDVVTYNGEHELFEIRYNMLKDFVDEFIVVEFDKTFSGKPKEPTFKYQDWDKVKYYLVSEDVWSKYMDMARNSPNTIGAKHWLTEFCQKESIKDCLTHLKDDDLIFIGDVDEIWEPKALDLMIHNGQPIIGNPIWKLKLKVYLYYLNIRSSEEFWGTILCRYGSIKNSCLNHVRTNKYSMKSEYCGWHFTSLGGIDALKKKMDDTYTEESYWHDGIKEKIDERHAKNQDFLGRPITLTLDESELPKYIIDNQNNYEHLFRE